MNTDKIELYTSDEIHKLCREDSNFYYKIKDVTRDDSHELLIQETEGKFCIIYPDGSGGLTMGLWENRLSTQRQEKRFKIISTQTGSILPNNNKEDIQGSLGVLHEKEVLQKYGFHSVYIDDDTELRFNNGNELILETVIDGGVVWIRLEHVKTINDYVNLVLLLTGKLPSELAKEKFK